MYFEIRETDIDRHLQTDDARALLAVWRGVAAAGPLPDFAAFWSEDLAMRPYMMAVSPIAGGDWRYSRVGSRLEEETGDHWRTELVSQIGDPDRAFISRCLALTASRAEPTYAIHSAPNTQNVLLWERLMLPCRGADGATIIAIFLHPLEYVEDMVRAVLETTPTAILRARCIRDADGRIVDAVCLLANELTCRFLNRGMNELIEGCVLELFPAFLETGVFERFAKVVETREPCRFEMQYRQHDETKWFSVAAVALGDGFTLSVADITEPKRVQLQLESARNELMAANAHLERQALDLEAARADLEAEVDCRKVLEEELRRLALTDALTGLANRPAIAAQGQALAISGRRRGLPLSAIAIDVDHFKTVNDTFGHSAGDKVLASLAMLMQEMIRIDLDVAGRLGGEEFVIILPRLDLEGAAEVAERMRAAFADHRIETEAATIGVTASFGVAEYREGEEFEELLARCDEALYRAKREGRDRVVKAVEPDSRAAA
jgi:diguanylate cyclase (GGDEF)-like protein